MAHNLPQSSKAGLSIVGSWLRNPNKFTEENMTDRNCLEAWGGPGYEKCADMVG